MVNFENGTFSIFPYTFTINCVTKGAQKMSIEYMFCFICSKQCIKIISWCKKCGLFGSVFKKIILNNTTPTFHEVGGVTWPLTFCQWHKTLSWYCFNHQKIDWFQLSRYFYFFLFATAWNEPERQIIAKLILPHRKILRVIFPLFRFKKYHLVLIQRA